MPIIPPIVARLEVEVSGPKPSPWAWAARLRSSCTTPGPTRTRRASMSSSRIAFMWRDVSSTTPCPAVCPARLVPPPRDTTGTSKRPAIRTAAATSAASRGKATDERLAGVHARVAGEEMARVVVRAHLSRAARAPAQPSAPASPRSHPTLEAVGRHFLQIPGPTNVPDRVLRAIDNPTIDHRGPAFAELGLEVLDGLRHVFQTSGPVVVYPSSGTGAWEAALVNTLSPGDRVLAFETGHFATLWRGMAEKLGLDGRVGGGRLAPRRRPRARAGDPRGRPVDRAP